MVEKMDKSHFNFFDDGSISIIDEKMDEIVEYINHGNIRKITISYWGYNQNNLNFLKKCPGIEEININNPNITNFSSIYSLKNLKTLNIPELNGCLEISKFERLEEYVGEYNSNLVGLNKCQKLKVLSLTNFNPKNRNLEELTFLNELRFLQIINSKIISFKGVEYLHKLKELQIIRASKLEIIDEIEKISDHLIILKFDRCKNIKNHEYVKCLKNLEILAFNNCGSIPSIHFIKGMTKLKQFIFVDTNIIDGDLFPLLGLEYSGFFDKKHYSHKFKELNDKKYWS